VVSNT